MHGDDDCGLYLLADPLCSLGIERIHAADGYQQYVDLAETAQSFGVQLVAEIAAVGYGEIFGSDDGCEIIPALCAHGLVMEGVDAAHRKAGL